MKKILMAILVAVLSLSCVFAFTSCKQEEALKVTITYDANGGIVAESSQEVDVDNYELLIPTRDGYTFKGWTLNGDPFTKENLLRNDVTLVATWEINKFNVTFETGSRGTLVGEKTQNLNAVGYALPTVTAKPGAEFIGWTLNGADFSSNTVLTADITLSAKYNVTAYTVTYVYDGLLKRNGETLNLEGDSELLVKEGYVLPEVKQDGYEFKGWKIQGTNDVLNGQALTDDVVLVAELELKKFSVSYFVSQDAFNAYLSSGEYVADTYEKVDNIVYDSNFVIENTIAAPFGKTIVGWKGVCVENGFNVTINNFADCVWAYEGNVYVYPVLVNDVFTVKYESGAFANFAGDVDFVESTVEVLGINEATLLQNLPIHDENRTFVGWELADGTVITEDAQLVAAIQGSVKGDVVILTAKFDENDYVIYRYNNTHLIAPIVAEVDKTYDTNVEGLATEIAKLEAANVGYHVEFFVGNEVFTSITFNEGNIATVIVDVKLVANKANVVLKVWGLDNDTSMGTINGGYSVTLENVANGEAIDVTLAGKGRYVFVCWTETAWTTETGSKPAATTILDANNVITVAEDGSTITLYAYFYNYIIA